MTDDQKDPNIAKLEAIRDDPNASDRDVTTAIRLLLEAQKGLKGSAADTAPRVVHVAFTKEHVAAVRKVQSEGATCEACGHVNARRDPAG